MKLFVVLALLGLCSRGYGRDFCADRADKKGSAEALFLSADTYLKQIITESTCKSAYDHIDAGTFFAAECEAAFVQGFCFGSKVYEDFGPEEGEVCVDDSKKIDTYVEMAKFATKYVGPIGESACSNALPCLKRAVQLITDCADEYDTFFEDVTTNAFNVIRDNFGDDDLSDMMSFAEDYLMCDYSDDADAQCLINLANEQSVTINGIEEEVKKFIANIKQKDELLQDARDGLDEFLAEARVFCKTGCASKSTTFFSHLFVGTDCSVSCPTTETYCGGCEQNANNFLDWYPKATPCCTKNALGNIMNAFNFVNDNYGEDLKKMEADALAYLREQTNCGGAATRYQEYVAHLTDQATCLNNTYTKIESGCCTRCPNKGFCPRNEM